MPPANKLCAPQCCSGDDAVPHANRVTVSAVTVSGPAAALTIPERTPPAVQAEAATGAIAAQAEGEAATAAAATAAAAASAEVAGTEEISDGLVLETTETPRPSTHRVS